MKKLDGELQLSNLNNRATEGEPEMKGLVETAAIASALNFLYSV